MSAVKADLPQGDATKPRQIVPTSEGYSLREGARPLVKPGASGQLTPGMFLFFLFFGPAFITLASPFLLLWAMIWSFGFLSKLTAQAISADPDINADQHTGYLALVFLAFGIVATTMTFFQFATLKLMAWFFLGALYLFLVYLLLGAVYWGLKFIIDPDTRQALGFRWSLDKLEIIFSRYPLNVGENDRLHLRRRLKETVWTQLCNLRAFPDNSWATVTLLCVEEVKYTKGTDTLTEQAEAYSQVVYSHSLPWGESMVNSYFDLEIPPNLSASFEGKNNQIRWLLKIEEHYGHWLKSKITYLPFLVDV